MMSNYRTIELPVKGMDCAECTQHVQHALSQVPGVKEAVVFLAAEKAVLVTDEQRFDLAGARAAVKAAGYEIPEQSSEIQVSPNQKTAQSAVTAAGFVIGFVVFVLVLGEWLGLFETLTRLIPWYFWLTAVLLGGWPIFVNVVRATRQKQIISHTLMSLGVIAAIAVGEWPTAAVVVLFMRVGDAVEHFTSNRSRRALHDLSELAPQTARKLVDGIEIMVAISQVQPEDVVVVRPGEVIPVDGFVIEGEAAVDQSAVTGETMPLDAAIGSRVFAASIVKEGSLRVNASAVGADSTFGKVVSLVEQAEANKGLFQRAADRFAGYYLPVVTGIALLTWLARGDALAAASVLVVACSCSFTLATPIAILASIAASARQGMLIKGGRYLETLERATTLFVDKTGTLTLGKPAITDVHPLGELDEQEILRLASGAERYSEHPLAEAVRQAASQRGISLPQAEGFRSLPGRGVQADIGGHAVSVLGEKGYAAALPPEALRLKEQGKALLLVSVDGKLEGILAASDQPRVDVGIVMEELRTLGIKRIELLTGDHAQAAAGLAQTLGIPFQAGLLPEDKIAVVRAAQAAGEVVVMIGDGVNDAPALAQADIGIAMGAGGSAIASQAAGIVLLRDDWLLVAHVFRTAKRTLRVVRGNIIFTALYNLAGISLAALGILPPALAAAAQSLPDIGILANSARLLKQ